MSCTFHIQLASKLHMFACLVVLGTIWVLTKRKSTTNYLLYACKMVLGWVQFGRRNVQGGKAAQYMNTIQYLELLSSTPAHSTFTLRFILLLCKYNCVTVKYAAVKLLLWGGSKGLINFPWIFDAMRSLVPVGHFGNISRHLFTWLVCRSFQWRHGLLFTDCIVWDDKVTRTKWLILKDHIGST